MLDIIGGIAIVGLVAILAGVLTGAAGVSPRHRLTAFVGLGVWVALLIAASVLGWFDPGAVGPVPTIAYPLAAVLAAGLVSWFRVPRFRERVRAMPLPVLIAANIGRVLGVFFLVLYGVGRVPAPFAQSAGWGDIVVGTLALPLAVMAAAGSARPLWIGLWNAFGMLDLVTAVALGVLSSPGTPFRVFGSGSAPFAVTALPWVLIPTFLVPVYFLVHLAIAARLRAPGAVGREPVTA